MVEHTVAATCGASCKLAMCARTAFASGRIAPTCSFACTAHKSPANLHWTLTATEDPIASRLLNIIVVEAADNALGLRR